MVSPMSTTPIVSSPIETRPREVEFTARFVQPPGALYVDPDDRLYVEFVSAFAFTRFHVAARMLKPEARGEIIHQEFELETDAVAGTWGFAVFPLQEGFVLGVAVHPTELVLARGELYVVVGLLRGTDVRQSATEILCAGFVSGPTAPSYPAGGIEDSVSGRGRILRVTTADPVAGAEISHQVPDRKRWRLLSMKYQLVTSATVATRRSIIQLTQQAAISLRAPSSFGQAASLTIRYNAAHWGMDSVNLNGEVMLNLPSTVWLLSADIFGTFTANLQVGDNYTAAELMVEEWPVDL